MLSKILAKDPTEVLEAITAQTGATGADHMGVDRKLALTSPGFAEQALEALNDG
ncbi:hypothetical protein [Sinorhizobium meliloti]|uniref:hypothetical protein n=1 Tax=Rhizobium meliloti TaxID=382 RepID=UPI0030A3912A